MKLPKRILGLFDSLIISYVSCKPPEKTPHPPLTLSYRCNRPAPSKALSKDCVVNF